MFSEFLSCLRREPILCATPFLRICCSCKSKGKRDVELFTTMTKSKADADLPLDPSIGEHAVFISHRGIDMKRTFANQLYYSLKNRGIKAFLDIEEFPKGGDVRPFMLEAARRAIVQVPIITSTYAESTWCLDELAIMMHTKSSNKAKVLPVFYDVMPEDLRNKDGPFAKDIEDHRKKGERNEDTIKGWENALYAASWLDGYRLETYNRCEGKLSTDLVEKIVQETQERIRPEDDPNAVGLETRVHEVVEQFHLKEKTNVFFLLLWGMGGIGKTTLARAIFYRLKKEFQATSFVENFGNQELNRVQDSLLIDLLHQKNFCRDVGAGKKCLKDGLSEKEVLIILDNVKDFDSIEKVIDLTSLHPRSLILVTSRSQSVYPHKTTLSEVFEGDRYEVRGMVGGESLRLLCLRAFKKPFPEPGFEDLAERVSQACHGLPLSLVVLGHHLSRRMEERMWVEAIGKLKRLQYRDIEGTLMISYEALDDEEREMFLDVACLLIDEDKRSAEFFWDGMFEAWSTCLWSLVDLCLVKVVNRGNPYQGEQLEFLTMHDQLRDLGRIIVRKEYKNSGIWSRVWDNADLSQVLQKKQGLDQIRGLATSLPTLSTGLLSQMISLKLLFLDGTHLDGDYEVLEQLEIRWLKFIRFDVSLKELVDSKLLIVLTTRFGKQMELSFSHGRLEKLRKLDISRWSLELLTEDFGSPESLEESAIRNFPSFVHLKKLRKPFLVEASLEDIGSLESPEALDVHNILTTKVPSFFPQMKKLRDLSFRDCTQLKELPEDFGSLESLERLDVTGSEIKKLPPSFGQLKKLQILNICISDCLEELPEDFGSLENLEVLDAKETAITKLPSSFGQLKKLRILCMERSNRLEQLSEDFGSLESLELLNVEASAITQLPSSFGQLKKLQILNMAGCDRLEQLPEDFGSLESLEELCVDNSAIMKFPSSLGQLKKLQVLSMRYCKRLEQLPENFGSLKSLEQFYARKSAITSLPSSFRQLKKVWALEMGECYRVGQLPLNFESPENLEELDDDAAFFYTDSCFADKT